jgi:hypothetical protein
MASQRALFTEIEQRLSAGEPRGFRYQEQIISEEVEASLAERAERHDDGEEYCSLICNDGGCSEHYVA